MAAFAGAGVFGAPSWISPALSGLPLAAAIWTTGVATFDFAMPALYCSGVALNF
jgi:hypothetical protein